MKITSSEIIVFMLKHKPFSHLNPKERSRISPLTASETFTQSRMQRIGAGFLHSKGREDGATETSPGVPC